MYLSSTKTNNRYLPSFAGVLNTGLQLTVGVSGATLDIFFLNRKLGRHKVVATKAVTQAIGHMAKLYYFGIALNTEATAQFNQLPIWLILGILAMTFLGTGISNGIKLNEIVILNKKSGKPYISIIGQTKKILNKRFKRKKSKISLSLSDEKKYAVAFVTISI